ncbi:AMP-binding protein [Dictyobacter alpinus]|nr:AMP-binding protein [Dictyobacter alpinus]
MKQEFSNLVDMLRWRAATQPDRCVYTFLQDGETDVSTLTFAELDRQARKIAAVLQSRYLQGERVLLLFAPGLEYITAFFGCLYAQVIAVPAYPPKQNRNARRIEAILQDAQAVAALTSSSLHTMIMRKFSSVAALQQLQWFFFTGSAPYDEAGWVLPAIDGETLAFLQYTSGSTGTPKGVMVSHANLMYNLDCQRTRLVWYEDDCMVSWLPPYHDMGLINGLLGSIYMGFLTVLFTPASFLQHPLRWLKAITNFRGTISSAPNFAYDLCVRTISAADQQSLDLSSWRIATNGAEPILRSTIVQFMEKFQANGFQRTTLRPGYGLAEATLMVSSNATGDAIMIRTFDGSALGQGRACLAPDDAPHARALAGCGWIADGHQLKIVDPVTLVASATDEVGEIWVRGPGIAKGYWQRPEQTKQTFQAYTSDTGEGPFLRTGDLGFQHKGELFITGRLKDVIIIRGVNHYPQDIEQTVAACHEALVADGGAAFSLIDDDREQLVVVSEVSRQFRNNDFSEIMIAIRRAVIEEHDVEVAAIALLKAGMIPKTSSGKIQRQLCRQQFLQGSLEYVDLWHLNHLESAIARQLRELKQSLLPKTHDGDIDWQQIIAATAPSSEATFVSPVSAMERAIASVWLEVLPVKQVGIQDNFFDLGGTSQLMVEAHYRLCKRLNRDDVSVLDMFFAHPTVATLAEFLSGEKWEDSIPEPAGHEEQKRAAHDRIRDVQQRQRQNRLAHRMANKEMR